MGKPFVYQSGFTSIEILLGVLIVSLLAAIIIVIVNPWGQLAEGRNIQRRADVSIILDALRQYQIDNGQLPVSVPLVPTEICRSGVSLNCTGLVNLNVLTGAYLHALPADPLAATATSTRYTVARAGDHVVVAAPFAERGAVIRSER